MPNQLYPVPPRIVDENVNASAGAKLYFYITGTTTPLTVYTTEAADVPHPSPLVAGADGSLPAIWLETGAAKCVITDATDATLATIDPVVATAGSGLTAADIPFAPTVELPFTNVQDAIVGAAESAASGYAVFGLGITGNATLLADIDATNIGAGAARFDATTTGTFPTGVAAADGGIIEEWRQSSGAAMMMLYHATTDRIFHRRMTASAWGTWRENITVNQGAAQGDTIYRTASAWARLAKGTAKQVYTMNSGATAPEWVASGAPVLLAAKTASASATLDFTEFNNAVYSRYRFVLKNVKPATDIVILRVRLSTDGGATYDAAASDYQYVTWGADPVSGNHSGSSSASGISITDGTLASTARNVGNAAGEYGVSGEVTVEGANSGSVATTLRTSLDFDNANGEQYSINGSGRRNAAQDTTALRFLFTSGNIASGIIEMWGLI